MKWLNKLFGIPTIEDLPLTKQQFTNEVKRQLKIRNQNLRGEQE